MDERHVGLVLDGNRVVAIKPAKKQSQEPSLQPEHPDDFLPGDGAVKRDFPSEALDHFAW
jgi:hypothetical protein